MLNKKAIKLLIFIPVILVLVSGCSRYEPRSIDITKGEYYEEEEYQKLSKKDREAYCAKLAGELESLTRRSEDAQAQFEKNKQDIRTMTQELRDAERDYSRLTTELDELNQQLQELEQLPKEWVLQYGECLWNLAGYEEIYSDPLKWTRIWRANWELIEDPDWVLAGWTLKIPRNWPRRHQVQQDEWLAKIAGYWEVYDNYRKWPLLYEANKDGIRDPDLIFPDQDLVIPRDESLSE
ncbi:MAG: LysM peptidoglycan-binding domain-containing protein [Candidatus Krumholzibacteriota bacterium]|nr:LysM peptidoglycan-binding domain-containing protein [Candidatus Krumholzibacteriota bacterium]